VQVEALTMERDQLQHEVAMLRETVRHSAVQSADAARASRASLPSDTAAHDPPTNSMAAHFHAHTARIQELQGSIEVRRPSRSQHLPPSLRRTCLMRAPHARVRSGALAAHAALTPTHMCAARPERCCCHLQELEQERDSLERQLHEERERRDQQAMSLRQEVAAVQITLIDEKERMCVGDPCSIRLTLCVTIHPRWR
jgi:hypothetical protein